MKKITLILGGIRSGKSCFAEQKAEYYSERPVYIATGVAFDKEMKERIAMHRARRGDRYEVMEVPYDITGPLRRYKNRTVLVDCLTLNLSNRLMASEEHMDMAELIETDDEYLAEVNEIIAKNNLNVIFVSNEVGLAPIESNKLARYFQDLQGRWNRQVAQFADEVYVVEAGVPRQIKKKPVYPFRLSAPSYVLPTGYIENVTYLIDRVDDIQLLVFDSLPEDPLFKEDMMMTLEYLVRDVDKSYTVHMPVKPKLDIDFDGREKGACTIIEKTAGLNVKSYTVHYDLPDGVRWEELSDEEKRVIDERYIRFFQAVKAMHPGVDLSLENTATPLSALDRVVQESNISYAIDIGHLEIQGWDLIEIESRLPRASVVHLHGIAERNGKPKDHCEIVYNRQIFQWLETFRGILTIENYHKLILEKSIDVLKKYF
jgi:adenosylcobinamide kinase / adenosylcobinamide-phosphate guanylyltransferase